MSSGVYVRGQLDDRRAYLEETVQVPVAQKQKQKKCRKRPTSEEPPPPPSPRRVITVYTCAHFRKAAPYTRRSRYPTYHTSQGGNALLLARRWGS